MGFASAWLDERALFPPFIRKKPESQTGIIVVIPAYNEPGIITTLNSLRSCMPPACGTEVIIVVNAPPDAGSDELSNNEKCIAEIERWKNAGNPCFFSLHILNIGRSDLKDWGVGMARKTGMDEALRRFNDSDNPDGVIVCLDADCSVDRNYCTSLENDFLRIPSLNACSLYFEHYIPESLENQNIGNSIIQYELHLRIYLQGLIYAGFPYAFHTVGSSMAVRAAQYMKAGGMNRRKAGEDFYFIQKLVELGGYFSLNSTTVHPSARESHRVPFGTGASMRKMTGNAGEELLTYNTAAFEELRVLFGMSEKMRLCDWDNIKEIYFNLPEGLRHFTAQDEFAAKINEIRNNTSGPAAFRKRFFVWFNMFRVVKYLNDTHRYLFEKQPVVTAARELLKLKGLKDIPADHLMLLEYYRQLERT